MFFLPYESVKMNWECCVCLTLANSEPTSLSVADLKAAVLCFLYNASVVFSTCSKHERKKIYKITTSFFRILVSDWSITAFHSQIFMYNDRFILMRFTEIQITLTFGSVLLIIGI